MSKFLQRIQFYSKACIFALMIFAGSSFLLSPVQAAGVDPLMQGLSENPRVYGKGQLDDEIGFKKGTAVAIKEQGKNRARAVYFAAYIPAGGLAYRIAHLKSGHLIIDGYDCQLFSGQAHPLFYKQYDVDLNKKQWRVWAIHEVNADNWGIHKWDCVPEDLSYVPMEDYIWQTILKLVPPEVIAELKAE